MRNMTPAEAASLYAVLRSAEHALLAYVTCPEGAGACPSCQERYQAEAVAESDYQRGYQKGFRHGQRTATPFGGSGTLPADYLVANPGPWH